MSSNDLVLLRELLSQQKQMMAPEMPVSDYFELFVAEQALKERDLSYDEIKDGIVDGGGDGGIDSVYIFINNTLCIEAIDQGDYKRNAPIELVIIQSKNTSGLSESGLDKFCASASDFFNLDCDLNQLRQVYNNDLLEKIMLFQDCYKKLTSKFPKLIIRYYYAAFATEVHPNVDRKVEQLRRVVESFFNPVEFSFEFLTADKLLDLARRSLKISYHLKLAETPISTGQNAYVCLVKLKDYFNFIADDGVLNESIFEGNVRDYQGNTEVNQKIRETLDAKLFEDFWWLNNGVSILCTEAIVSGKTLTLDNAEIVNGLQTSREIYNYFATNQASDENRALLVRVIVTDDSESRDLIIQATNSQTSIPIASLRATDKIHRDIEDYLSVRGLFYERRKNYYKNKGKPIRKIVSIGFMAQAVLTCSLGEPANARARPSSSIKSDDDYRRIFCEENPLEAYYNSVEIILRVEDILRNDDCQIPRAHWNNIKFYAAMLVVSKLINPNPHSFAQMAKIDLSVVDDDLINECISLTWGEFETLGGTDQVAKGRQLKSRLLEALGEEI